MVLVQPVAEYGAAHLYQTNHKLNQVIYNVYAIKSQIIVRVSVAVFIRVTPTHCAHILLLPPDSLILLVVVEV